MGYTSDDPAAARRHLDAADHLAGGTRRPVAGYLYGIAAECAVKAIQRRRGPCRVHRSRAMYSPIASARVSPGDSMPKRLTSPGTPWVAGPSMRKSGAGSWGRGSWSVRRCSRGVAPRWAGPASSGGWRRSRPPRARGRPGSRGPRGPRGPAIRGRGRSAPDRPSPGSGARRARRPAGPGRPGAARAPGRSGRNSCPWRSVRGGCAAGRDPRWCAPRRRPGGRRH